MNHLSNLNTSPRLQRVLQFLVDRGAQGATSREVNLLCDVMNPGEAVSSLNKNGVMIECHPEGVNANGRRVFRYILIKNMRTEKAASAPPAKEKP